MADPVLSLADPSATEPSVSGGKGATLARLRALDFPVPDGVVVTTDVFRALLDDPTAETHYARLRAAAGAGDENERNAAAADLRDAIRERALPAAVVAALDEALSDGPYAVRSSATTEDRPDASFAGQHDTRLDVARGDVPAAVVDCFASAFTDRAVAYRARTDVDEDVAMAVVVQRFVDPDASGVLFSADPLTGERGVAVVDAGPGRGDAQVSGRTTADTLRVDRRSGTVVEYRLGADRNERVLTDRDAVALAALGARVEDALGAPQDVEWAMVDGRLVVLQARPITALFPLPDPRPGDDRTHVYFSFGHRQGMPDAMPPLVLDAWREETDALRRLFGLSKRFAATAGGRLYVDLTAYLDSPWLRERVLANVAMVDARASDALRSLLADRPDEFPRRRASPARYWRALAALARLRPAVGPVLASFPRALLAPDPRAERRRIEAAYDDACERALARIRAGETTADRLAAARDEVHASLRWLLEPFYGAFVSALLAGRLLRRLDPSGGDHVDALALGAADDPVYRMTADLDALAGVARETPAVAAALRDGAGLDDVAEIDGSDAFLDALDGFLDEYGFRAVGEIDFSRPRYREDPAPLLSVVASALESDDGPARVHDALASRARAAERALVRETNPLLRPVVRRLVAVYRGYVGVRELPKFVFARLLDERRTQTLAAGEELASRGALDDPDDVWMLTCDELERGLDDPRALLGIPVAARRREFERVRRLPAPRVLTSDGYVPRDAPDGDVDARLHGTAAAPGVAEGVVRVVTDPASERLARGEILVAPYTDPGWTPLFLNAAAVVTDVGGRLTHGSLVAREYGIPAVVAVDDATTRLRTGDRVRVDGTAGTVERLD